MAAHRKARTAFFLLAVGISPLSREISSAKTFSSSNFRRFSQIVRQASPTPVTSAAIKKDASPLNSAHFLCIKRPSKNYADFGKSPKNRAKTPKEPKTPKNRPKTPKKSQKTPQNRPERRKNNRLAPKHPVKSQRKTVPHSEPPDSWPPEVAKRPPRELNLSPTPRRQRKNTVKQSIFSFLVLFALIMACLQKNDCKKAQKIYSLR